VHHQVETAQAFGVDHGAIQWPRPLQLWSKPPGPSAKSSPGASIARPRRLHSVGRPGRDDQRQPIPRVTAQPDRSLMEVRGDHGRLYQATGMLITPRTSIWFFHSTSPASRKPGSRVNRARSASCGSTLASAALAQ
jgi:hypothetical protein